MRAHRHEQTFGWRADTRRKDALAAIAHVPLIRDSRAARRLGVVDRSPWPADAPSSVAAHRLGRALSAEVDTGRRQVDLVIIRQAA